MNMTAKKRGRPCLPPGEAKVRGMTVRLKDALWERIEQMAQDEGRSLSMQVTWLIENALTGRDQRTLIREEVRAALAERDDEVPGSQPIDRPGQLYRY